jgi:hypothetical protein
LYVMCSCELSPSINQCNSSNGDDGINFACADGYGIATTMDYGGRWTIAVIIM